MHDVSYGSDIDFTSFNIEEALWIRYLLHHLNCDLAIKQVIAKYR